LGNKTKPSCDQLMGVANLV